MAQKIKSLSISVQTMSIKRMFPDTAVTNTHDQLLTWVNTISPSPLGDAYKIRLVYHISDIRPKVYVLNPKPLPLAKNRENLPHCYDYVKQELCLFFPDGREWNKTMLLTATIIPWIYEWLYHYEIWVGSGDWFGGGVHLTKQNH